MILRKLGICLSIVVFTPAFAVAKTAKRVVAETPPVGECGAQRWKDRRDLSKQQLVAKLQAMPRDRIRQMAWGELLSKNSKPIFPFLFMYLAKTESSDLLAGYYEGVLYMTNQTIQWRDVAEQWPQPIDLRQVNAKAWTLSTLCKEYRLAGGTL